MKNYTTLLIELQKTQKISIYELAQIFKVSVPFIQTICLQYGLGVVTEDDFIYIDTEDELYSDEFQRIETYLKYPDIGDKMIKYIKENQPVTLHNLVEHFQISRRKLERILADITFQDRHIYSEKYKTYELLFYGE